MAAQEQSGSGNTTPGNKTKLPTVERCMPSKLCNNIVLLSEITIT